MKKYFYLLFAMFALLLVTVSSVSLGVAQAKSVEDVNARSAILVDADSGSVVYSKEECKRLQIASMVKIMTLNLVFEEIDKGTLTYDTDIVASANATAMGGSQAYLDTNSVYKAGELIKSVIVASANDSCVALAEHISGSVPAFVDRMNESATMMGLENTVFVNCTGLPAPNQYSCAQDVAKMFGRLIKHNVFFGYAGEWMYDFVHPSGRSTTLTNTNKLVRFYDGCDGGKTGFTSEALSCLAATAKRGETRFICVVIGADNAKIRNAEVSKLLNYGFGAFETKRFIAKDCKLDEKIEVSGGKVRELTLSAGDDITAFVPKGEEGDFTLEKKFFDVNAPVRRGDVVGKIELVKNGEIIDFCNIIADYDIDKKDFMDFVKDITEKW